MIICVAECVAEYVAEYVAECVAGYIAACDMCNTSHERE